MTANTAVSLPLGPLDPERSELLRRVVDGLEPASLQWLSGFASGVAYARGQAAPVGHEGLHVPRRPSPRGRNPRRGSRSSTARRPAMASASPSGSGGQPRPPASPCASTRRATTR